MGKEKINPPMYTGPWGQLKPEKCWAYKGVLIHPGNILGDYHKGDCGDDGGITTDCKSVTFKETE